MSHVLHRYTIRFHNFASLLCLKEQNGSYKVSHTSSLLNCLKMPFIIVFAVLYVIYSNTEDKKSSIDLKKFSTFSLASLVIMTVSAYVSSTCLIVLQVINRYPMKNFFNNWLRSSLGQEYLIEFQRICLRNDIALVVVFSVFSSIQYFGLTKITLISFAATMVLLYPNIVLVNVISFVTSFQNFVAISLKEFRKSIQISQQKSSKSEHVAESYLQLSRKYQELHDLVQQFNDCFGHSLTLMTCYVIMTLTLTVR